jgi:hypothetical protein
MASLAGASLAHPGPEPAARSYISTRSDRKWSPGTQSTASCDFHTGLEMMQANC